MPHIHCNFIINFACFYSSTGMVDTRWISRKRDACATIIQNQYLSTTNGLKRRGLWQCGHSDTRCGVLNASAGSFRQGASSGESRASLVIPAMVSSIFISATRCFPHYSQRAVMVSSHLPSFHCQTPFILQKHLLSRV